MKIAGKDVDIAKKDEQYRILEYIRMKRIKTLPFLSYLLIGCSKFEDSSDCAFYGWTVFNPSNQFYTIKLNWKKIANDNLSVEVLEFIAYHNVLHHMLLHFVREPIVNYYRKSPYHADICMDTVVNEYLLRHLGFNENDAVTHWVENNGFTYAKFLAYFKMSHFPFTTDVVVSVEQLIECAKKFEEKSRTDSSPSKQKDDSSDANDIIESNSQEDETESEENKPSSSLSLSKQQGQKGIQNKSERNVRGIFDDHYLSLNENEEIKRKTNMSSATLEELFMNSLDNLTERALKQGIIPSKEEGRFIAILKTKKNYLSVVKLKNLSSSFSKGKRIRTWTKVHRHKEFFTGIHYPAKKIETKKHIVYAIDTSGSVSEDELGNIKSIIVNHAKQYEDEIVCDIIVWSGTVTNTYKNISTIKGIIALQTTTTWATNIDKLFSYIEKQYTRKIICVILTDGYIRQEKVPSIIDNLYFALTKQDSLEKVKRMYPAAVTLSLII